MKKQALALAIASALAAPSALAAQDTSGMQYTSASEGFYASLRGQLDFANSDNDASIGGGSSRIGIRGTNDLGGGLEGFYQYELQVGINDAANANADEDGAELRTRLGHVGLRGNFGEFVVGSFWTADYGFTHGSTDVANNYSGYLNYTTEREGRSEQSVQYTTPDLNGFQGAVLAKVGGGTDDNDLDLWNLSAQYAIQGFTVGGSYNVITDTNYTVGVLAEDQYRAAVAAVPAADAQCSGGAAVPANGTCPAGETYEAATPAEAAITAQTGLVVDDDEIVSDNKEDLTSWTLRLGYAQDNWYVNGWYGEDSTSDYSADVAVRDGTTGTDTVVNISADDTELFSLAAGVAVDKVNLYGVYEVRETDFTGGDVSLSREDSYGTIGVQYNLGAQSRVWIEYWARDLDSNPAAEDVINIGLRHDF